MVTDEFLSPGKRTDFMLLPTGGYGEFIEGRSARGSLPEPYLSLCVEDQASITRSPPVGVANAVCKAGG